MQSIPEPEYDPVHENLERKTRRLTLSVPKQTLRSWIEAADRCGMTLNDWVVLGISLADHLALVEGYVRLPNGGATIDPVLAEAIRRAAIGQPWEHKAMMLLGAPALMPNRYSSGAPEALAPRWPETEPPHINVATARMAEYGLPLRNPAKNGYYTVLLGEVLTWGQTAMLLAIWSRARGGWTNVRYKEMVLESGLGHRRVTSMVKNLRERGIIIREPIPRARNMGEARVRTRIAPQFAEALLRGELRPVTVADLVTDQFENRNLTGEPDDDILWARTQIAPDHPMRQALVKKRADERKRARERAARRSVHQRG